MTDALPPATPLADLSLDALRPHLVEAMLVHVPFDGWSRTAAEAALRDLGLDPAIAGIAFPGGSFAMLDAYTALADAHMQAAAAMPEFRALKVRDKVAGAILARLEWATPHREAVRRATALLALPLHLPRAPKLAWRTADAIWRAAGDTATDFNHYSKRALAAAVYTSTLLFWLNDDSAGQADTRAFLERRIANVMQIEKAKARFANRPEDERPSLARFLGRLRYPAA